MSNQCVVYKAKTAVDTGGLTAQLFLRRTVSQHLEKVSTGLSRCGVPQCFDTARTGYGDEFVVNGTHQGQSCPSNWTVWTGAGGEIRSTGL